MGMGMGMGMCMGLFFFFFDGNVGQIVGCALPSPATSACPGFPFWRWRTGLFRRMYEDGYGYGYEDGDGDGMEMGMGGV